MLKEHDKVGLGTKASGYKIKTTSLPITEVQSLLSRNTFEENNDWDAKEGSEC